MAEIRVHKYDSGGWCEQSYEGDRLHGNWTVYFANGNKSWERQYVHGLQDGYCRTWNEQGQLIEEEWYHLDESHGVWRKWDEAGNERVIGDFYFGYECNELESRPNPDFQAAIRPYLALEPHEAAAQLPIILPQMRRTSVLMRKAAEPAADLTVRSSYWNFVNVMRANETWPVWNRKPLFPILQIRCDEIPATDHPLARFAYVTLFSVSEYLPGCLGEDLVIRAYRPADEIVTVVPPVDSLGPPTAMLLTETIDNYPDENDLPRGLREYLRETGNVQGVLEQPERCDSRIGGWPSWIQFSRVAHRAKFAFQVDGFEAAKFPCGDNGMHYFFWDEQKQVFDWVDESM